jgi:hypothetical protein
MKTLTIYLEKHFQDTRETALKRVMQQKNITEADLSDYEIKFIGEPKQEKTTVNKAPVRYLITN